MATIAAAPLEQFAASLLEAGGFATSDARAMAQLLVWANLRGVDSHGVLRIPRYLEMLSAGDVKADHTITPVHQFGAISVLDADGAPGAVAMNRAVHDAGALARAFGIGWCAVKRTSHAGAIGYFVEQLARTGRIGIAMTASKPLMSYHGARGEALSTNPLAIAVPLPDGRDPLILDMSTGAVALGKIMAARDAGRSIPQGWAVDAAGAVTTDPAAVAAVLPMAGAKGSGLSLMIELLCSVLAGNPSIAPALLGGESGGFNGLVIAVEPAAFGDPAAFASEAGVLASAISALAPAADNDKVRLPGERGYETARLRTSEGITLSAGTVRRLVAEALRLAVAVPASLA